MRAYRDPTADIAIAHVMRKKKEKHSGIARYHEPKHTGGKTIRINKAEWFYSRFNRAIKEGNMELKVTYMSPEELVPYENNAKRHPEEQIEQIKESIKEFGFNDPIAIDKNNIIIEGHGRLIAAQEMGFDRVPVIRLDGLTEEQRKAYTLVHNKLTMNSDFEHELLNIELDSIDLDMSRFGFDLQLDDVDEYLYEPEYANNLQKHFGVPPFSVLDARQGYWQDRKKAWLEITGNLSETRNGEYGKISGGASLTDKINDGTSNFDPVLAETMYKWFCVDGGKILDPFGGEQTKGVVAGELGYKYHGCEIREDQVKLNNECTSRYKDVKYYCGDSNYISEIIKDKDFDMCFTSPPYYDLEVYSADDLSSLGSYEEFMEMYRNIFEQCYKMLAEDTFLVIKVGEIRDKKTGEYRCFVADNVKLFTDVGFVFYNDIVLVTPIGTAPLRANNGMRTRKVVKTHQNVLVFYKGDLKNISKKYPRLDFEDMEEE